MNRVVVDASVAIKWIVPEPDTPNAMQLVADHHLIAPDLLMAECANVLRSKIRAGEFDLELLDEAASVLRSAGVVLVPMEPLFAKSVRIASLLRHPAYDCFYLALALAEQCPFVTADERFLRAVATYGDAEQRAICKALGDVIAK